MRAGQRKAGAGVIESSIQPGRGAVALRAGLRESDLYVVGILGGGKVLHMAGDAVALRALIAPDYVARRAVQLRVRAGERKAGESGVIEVRARPCIHRGMALLALRRETKSSVAGCFSAQVPIHVAAEAVRG